MTNVNKIQDNLLTWSRDMFISEYQDYLDITKEKDDLYADAAILAEEIREIREKAGYNITTEAIKAELDKRKK